VTFSTPTPVYNNDFRLEVARPESAPKFPEADF
jgi:hypothetical protein